MVVKAKKVIGDMLVAPPKKFTLPKTPFTVKMAFERNSDSCELTVRNKIDEYLASGKIIALKARKAGQGWCWSPEGGFHREGEVQRLQTRQGRRRFQDAQGEDCQAHPSGCHRGIAHAGSLACPPVTHPQVVAPPTATFTPATCRHPRLR